MVNAWEWLLKAKIVHDHDQKMDRIYIPTNRIKKNGQPYKYKFQTNRSGTPKTISIGKAMDDCSLQDVLREQLNTLIEIRDNAIHFYNPSKELDQKVLGVFTATLKSVMTMVTEWFNPPKWSTHFFLIPVAFDLPSDFDATPLINKSNPSETDKLLSFIEQQEKDHPQKEGHAISFKVDLGFKKQPQPGVPTVHITKDKGAPVTVNAEDEFNNKYSWTHNTNLIPALKKKLGDAFKQDNVFRSRLKEIRKDERYARIKFLNSIEKKGRSQWFYNPSIIDAFAAFYPRKIRPNDHNLTTMSHKATQPA